MALNKAVTWILFGLFVVSMSAYLGSVPGLLGDEASEGENVYELLTSEGITVVGERSYIGPAIDYLRVPFIALFGYDTLALRVPMLLFSFITFWLAYSVLKTQFDNITALFGTTFLVFSPVYLLYGRLGWAITLFPFFAFLILWLLQKRVLSTWLWAGLAAGVGLANHILFFPVLAGIAVGVVVHIALGVVIRKKFHVPGWDSLRIAALALLYSFIGFWAGFGMQFAVLQLHTDDQGAPEETTQLFAERIDSFLDAAPLYISGSSFVARYTGKEFSVFIQTVIMWKILLLAGTGVAINWKKPAAWAWLFGTMALLLTQLYMIDRFTLRYFVMVALAVWMLAGVGVGSLARLFYKRVPSIEVSSIVIAVWLMGWMMVVVLVPFLKTGGSTADFSLGDRTNSASAFVDVRPLVECLRGKGLVFSEDVHIWNRLQYLSHKYPDLQVAPEENKREAEVLVEYQTNESTQDGRICDLVPHFYVVQK